MADTAVRRDLSDATVADKMAAQCAADPERLRLLYLLTIGDSRATGPAAWGTSKAALLRDLFVKAIGGGPPVQITDFPGQEAQPACQDGGEGNSSPG